MDDALELFGSMTPRASVDHLLCGVVAALAVGRRGHQQRSVADIHGVTVLAPERGMRDMPKRRVGLNLFGLELR